MCIRDSNYSIIESTNFISFVVLDNHAVYPYWILYYTTVSYTHLDVYKRQSITCEAQKSQNLKMIKLYENKEIWENEGEYHITFCYFTLKILYSNTTL